MKTSLRRRLLVSLAVTLLAAWSATALFSYLEARERIGQMLDEHLVQAATLILSLREADSGALRPAPYWGHADEGHALLYQGWSDDGRLLFKSAGAPDTPLSEVASGYSQVEREGERWRVYGTAAPDGHTRVLVAEHAHFREELAASVARHLLHPVAIALPVLAVLLWLAVRWGLRPLRVLANELGGREPDNLSPLSPGAPLVEVQPLVDSLNALFQRVAASVENERRFTADASHELRTPLAAIQTHLELALAARSEEERLAALGHVATATQRATQLVSQLLVLARLDARRSPPPAERVELAQLAREKVAEAAQLAAERGVNLGLAEVDAPVFAQGDAELLGILLRNFLDNALRYTPRGGRVDVLVRPEGERVHLEVADDGPGIPPEERAHVLERFSRGRQTGEDGSGLGLSIAARIAELHRGELTLGEGLGGRGLTIGVDLRSA